MAIQASVEFCMGQFIATLSDSQRIERSELLKMAEALHRAGVLANGVKFEWHSGLRMITAGQQVALCAAMRQQELHNLRTPAAA